MYAFPSFIPTKVDETSLSGNRNTAEGVSEEITELKDGRADNSPINFSPTNHSNKGRAVLDDGAIDVTTQKSNDTDSNKLCATQEIKNKADTLYTSDKLAHDQNSEKVESNSPSHPYHQPEHSVFVDDNSNNLVLSDSSASGKHGVMQEANLSTAQIQRSSLIGYSVVNHSAAQLSQAELKVATCIQVS